MAAHGAPPEYGNESAPPSYIDGGPSSAPLPRDNKSIVAQKLWVQSIDISGIYRRRFFVSADPISDSDPYSAVSSSASSNRGTRAPLYTLKNHGAHSSMSPRGSMSAKGLQQPDFTLYSGEGDEGPVVAVGMIHNNKLQKGIGEVRFFPRSSSNDGVGESSSSATERPSTIIHQSGEKKYVFELDGKQLEWEESGPGEPAPPPPPPPPPPPVVQPAPSGGGLFAKFKSKIGSPPRTPPTALPPRETVSLHLRCYDPDTGVRSHIATLIELQPLLSAEYLYRHAPPVYKDGHSCLLEIHDPFYTFLGASSDAARDLTVATLSLIFEFIRRETMKNRNRGLLSANTLATIA